MVRKSSISTCSTESNSSLELDSNMTPSKHNRPRGRDRMAELRGAGIYPPQNNMHIELRAMQGSGLIASKLLDRISQLDESLNEFPKALDELVQFQERANDTRIHETVLEKNRYLLMKASYRLHASLTQYKAEFQSLETKLESLPKHTPDYTMCFNQLMVLRRRHLNYVNQFHRIEKEYSERQKQLLLKELRVVNPSATEQDLESSSGTPFRDELLKATSDRYEVLSFVKTRQEEIKRVEESVQEVSNLFQELSSIVHDQDVLVDSIFMHADDAVNQMEQGNIEMDKAIRRRKAMIRASWFLLTILTLVLLALGIYAWVNFAGTSSAQDTDIPVATASIPSNSQVSTTRPPPANTNVNNAIQPTNPSSTNVPASNNVNVNGNRSIQVNTNANGNPPPQVNRNRINTATLPSSSTPFQSNIVVPATRPATSQPSVQVPAPPFVAPAAQTRVTRSTTPVNSQLPSTSDVPTGTTSQTNLPRQTALSAVAPVSVNPRTSLVGVSALGDEKNAEDDDEDGTERVVPDSTKPASDTVRKAQSEGQKNKDESETKENTLKKDSSLDDKQEIPRKEAVDSNRQG